MQEGGDFCAFSSAITIIREVTGDFIYKALILGNEQLLSNMIHREAT